MTNLTVERSKVPDRQVNQNVWVTVGGKPELVHIMPEQDGPLKESPMQEEGTKEHAC